MLVQKNKLLLLRFSSNTLPNSLTTAILEVLPVLPSVKTDLRFIKADISFGDVDITSHEISCYQISKKNLNDGVGEIKAGDWILPADDIPDVLSYIASYNNTTGLFGAETLLFDIVPNLNPVYMKRVLTYSFDDNNIYITAIATKQPNNAASLYFDGKYALLNTKFPYTVFSREIFKL